MNLSKKEYAAHQGVVPSRVTQWKQAGQLVLTPDGKVDVEASDALIERMRVPGKRRDVTRAVVGQAEQPASGGPGRKPYRNEDGESYTEVRVRRESWKAKTDEADYLERVGELVQRKRYDKSLADALGPILSKLESLPARIVSQVGEQEARRVQVVVEREVRDVRVEIAAALRALATSTQGQTRQ